MDSWETHHPSFSCRTPKTGAGCLLLQAADSPTASASLPTLPASFCWSPLTPESPLPRGLFQERPPFCSFLQGLDVPYRTHTHLCNAAPCLGARHLLALTGLQITEPPPARLPKLF